MPGHRTTLGGSWERQLKVSLIGHAAILIETRGVRILSDPWWQGPCFGVQWWIHPRPWLEPIAEASPDFIYISHGHSDHLHPGTLRRFPPSVKLLVSSATGLAEPLAKLGFATVALTPKEPREIAPGVTAEIVPTCANDTLLAVDDGTETCINLNDALHAAPPQVQEATARHLVERYGRADYVFCGYGIASHFPNCYEIPEKDGCATVIRRQAHFNASWAGIIARLQPKWGFPFAADVVILQDELMWSNEPLHNSERPVDRFRRLHPASPTRVYDAAPGFVIENGKVTRDCCFEPLSETELRKARAGEIAIANKARPASLAQVEELAAVLRHNVELSRKYLCEHSGSYRLLVRLTGSAGGIEIAKRGAALSVAPVKEPIDTNHYDLVFTTRYSYLRRALTTAYGHEVIFVGSGGVWRYRDRAAAARNLHSELGPLLRLTTRPPTSRFGDQPAWLYHVKQAVKRMIGQSQPDLYDLMTWTVFRS